MPNVLTDRRRVWRAVPLAVVAAAIALVTLWPLEGARQPLTWCLICGPLGAVDFFANILLFVPFGAAIVGLRMRVPWAVGAGVIFSGIIEALQWQLIAGRDASLGDLLANTMGSAAGAWLVMVSGTLLRPRRSTAAFLWTVWATSTVLVCVSAAWMLAPSRPVFIYWSQWTPSRTGYTPFTGGLESLRLFGQEIPNGTAIDPTTMPRAYAHGDLIIRARVISGPADSRRALIARAGNPLGEHFQLAQQAQSLVFRPRVNAARLGLRSPSLDLGRVMTPGVQELDLSFSNRRARLRVNGNEGGVVREQGLTVGFIWQVVSPLEVWSGVQHRVMAGLLFALLFAPLGYWEVLAYRSSRPIRSLATAAAALVVIPALFGMPIDGWAELFGSVLGIAIATVLPRRFASG